MQYRWKKSPTGGTLSHAISASLRILKRSDLSLIRREQIGTKTILAERQPLDLRKHLIRRFSRAFSRTENNPASPAEIAKRRTVRQSPAIQDRSLRRFGVCEAVMHRAGFGIYDRKRSALRSFGCTSDPRDYLPIYTCCPPGTSLAMDRLMSPPANAVSVVLGHFTLEVFGQ